MSDVTIWDSLDAWSNWVDESNPMADQTTFRRIINDSLKLPYKPILINGTNNSDIARWRFGQFFGDSDVFTDQTGNGNTSSIPADAPVETTEFGLSCQTKNGYAVINENSDFNFPKPTKQLAISCWIKSNITNYSSGLGIIVGYTVGSGEGEIAYALAINTLGRIRGLIKSSSTTQEIRSSDDDADNKDNVDTNWHHVLFVLGKDDTPSQHLLWVDNNPVTSGDIEFTDTPETITSGQFSIGSSQFDTSDGFSGYIDELYVLQSDEVTYSSNTRFETHIYLSPVINTFRSRSQLSSVLADFDTPNGSSVVFSFRASDTEFDQDDVSVKWTGFTSPDQISSLVETSLSDFGLFVAGQYQQIKIKLEPSSSVSPVADDLQTETPVVRSIKISSIKSDVLIYSSNTAYEPGKILGQIVNFSGDKRIDKVTLNLEVTSVDPKNLLIGEYGRISFSAVNFQSSRNAWVFQPVPHWTDERQWQTSGLTIQNTLQYQNYNEVEEAISSAPYLEYNLYFPDGGIWDIWGYGYIDGDGVFWSLDEDTTHLRRITLGYDISGYQGVPYWKKVGSVFFEEGGTHKFRVYLSNSSTVILDQWLFTSNTSFDSTLSNSGSSAYVTPLPNSKGPFMTVVRLRSLENGEIVPLTDPPNGANIISMYKSSLNIPASGKFNYKVQNSETDSGVIFGDGLSIEYMQIGGNSKHFASWNYMFV